MYFRKLLIIFFLLLTNCSTSNLIENKSKITFDKNFSNKGFALIYSDDLYNQGIISNKINEQSLLIFQKNLKTNTLVKVTNILNQKTLIVSVGKKTSYPLFNNSVLSIRVAEELVLDKNEPYIKIDEISSNSIFVAKKAKTYDEEKNVASKAPVNNISINDLNAVKIETGKKNVKKFSYKIKIADFYFIKSAKVMVDRIINETTIPNPKIEKISEEKYRVYLGPFNNINSLQKSYNDINILEFENIEITRHD